MEDVTWSVRLQGWFLRDKIVWGVHPSVLLVRHHRIIVIRVIHSHQLLTSTTTFAFPSAHLGTTPPTAPTPAKPANHPVKSALLLASTPASPVSKAITFLMPAACSSALPNTTKMFTNVLLVYHLVNSAQHSCLVRSV